MKLHYMGKFNLDPDTLPQAQHKPNSIVFKEANNMKKLAIIANSISVAIFILLAVLAFFRLRHSFNSGMILPAYLACICTLLTAFPHEILHALCFKKDVYMYTNLKQGMLFVTGTEDMSRGRFVIMSLLPNMIFGIIPYIIGMIFPNLVFLTVFGAICTGMGAGDYYNIFNALTQVPMGGRVYMSGMRSYWFMPEEN